MRFGRVPVAEAVGAISVHALRQGAAIIRKGTVVSDDQARALAASGIDAIVAARLEQGDVGEDEAAGRLAAALTGGEVVVEPPFTGRANLFAGRDGILCVEAGAIDRVNAVDESLTVATLPAFRPVVAGEMVATVKVIPYATTDTALADAIAAAGGPAVCVAPYRLRRVGAVSTTLPGLKPATVTKTVATLAERLAPMGAAVTADETCPHEPEALAAALARRRAAGDELIVVFGASAIADRRDVIPAAIEAAGGRIEHLGMPVDPGNLLLVAEIDGIPVVGAPGCARSPRENGFDWVLVRLVAGLPVRRQDIVRMGVGGLLMEIRSRGQPRSGEPSEPEA